MKRKFTLFITLLLVLLMLIPQTLLIVTAAAESKISVSNVETCRGETVSVTVNIANNPGIISALLRIDYDESVFTLTGVTDGGILGSSFHSNKYKSPYTLSWANDTAKSNIKSNGTAVTLTFKVAANATLKKYPITVSYNIDNYEIINKELKPVSFKLENGSINIKKDKDFYIVEPSETQIKYKNGIVLHTQYNGTLPKGATIEWTADNDNFVMITSDDGESCTVISETKGQTTFTATLYSKKGTVIATDTIQMQSKAGFFQKIFGFFRVLFGCEVILQA